MSTYQGQCLCGNLKYSFEGEPINSVFLLLSGLPDTNWFRQMVRLVGACRKISIYRW